jgi:hypothetical protein
VTSLSRKLTRNLARRNGVPIKTNPQHTILTADGGYLTLNPTKGWRKVSGKRLKGQ